jgi:hypothetical protein
MRRESWLTISAGADARSRAAEITNKGLRALLVADPAWGRMQTGIIDRFGRDKWMALVAELERLADCTRAAG